MVSKKLNEKVIREVNDATRHL